MGDFNIHINDLEDWDAQILQDTLNAFNLKQHINIPTHLLQWKTSACQNMKGYHKHKWQNNPMHQKIKYLGGHLDSSLTFKDHIIAKSKAATINIIKIRNIRKYLNQDTCHKLAITLVISHLDYSNSLLSGLPDSSIKILQRVQNSAARLVLGRNAKHSSMENINNYIGSQ